MKCKKCIKKKEINRLKVSHRFSHIVMECEKCKHKTLKIIFEEVQNER